jgi:threonyl-tRNA synthetase
MSNIEITLPDGSQQSVEAGTPPHRYRKSISPRLADAAIVAKVNGELYDLSAPRKGRQPPDPHRQGSRALEVYRHSTAHLLAAAVLELFPETKLGIGPPIENGFYYDFDRPPPFTPEDLEKIEKKMWEIQARTCPTSASTPAKPTASSKYADAWMKCELIEERADDVFSEYTLGPHFIDFCRGPHVPDTSKIKAFKLLSIAGAYWKGDEKNKQLQRIYGTAWFTKKELDDISTSSKKPRSATTASSARSSTCSAFRNSPDPGLIFFHPKGGIIRKQLEDWMRDQYLKRGYSLVYTPHVMRARSVEDFRPRQFLFARTCSRRMELDDAEYQLKPMNCPATS